jgi:hypothetical protein
MNKLSLNIDKTHFILFYYPKSKLERNFPPVKLENKLIHRQTYLKFLGVKIDENLSWVKHLNIVSSKVLRVIGILYRLKKQVPSEILLMIYHSTILPHLNYCITAWGNCKSKAWTRQETLHKKAVRLACKVKFNSHCAPIYKSQKILSLSHLFELNCCKMYARYLKGILPQYLNEQLRPVSSTHSHFTRQQNDSHINRCRHHIQHQSFNHKLSKAWNRIFPGR